VLRPPIRRWQRRQLMLSACFGATIACIILSSAEANSRMPLGIVVTIATLGPLAVSTLTRRRRVDCVWALLALAGVGLIAGLRGSVNVLGVIFAAGWAVAWAAYILLGTRLNREFAPREWLPVALAIAALLCVGPGVAQAGSALVRPVVLGYAAAAGVIGSVLTYVLELEALRRMATNAFSICMSFEPAFAVLWGLMLLGQHAAARELVGIACVITAAAATSRPATVELPA
jgi:inner membrane transporter RhtA